MHIIHFRNLMIIFEILENYADLEHTCKFVQKNIYISSTQTKNNTEAH